MGPPPSPNVLFTALHYVPRSSRAAPLPYLLLPSTVSLSSLPPAMFQLTGEIHLIPVYLTIPKPSSCLRTLNEQWNDPPKCRLSLSSRMILASPLMFLQSTENKVPTPTWQAVPVGKSHFYKYTNSTRSAEWSLKRQSSSSPPP